MVHGRRCGGWRRYGCGVGSRRRKRDWSRCWCRSGRWCCGRRWRSSGRCWGGWCRAWNCSGCRRRQHSRDCARNNGRWLCNLSGNQRVACPSHADYSTAPRRVHDLARRRCCCGCYSSRCRGGWRHEFDHWSGRQSCDRRRVWRCHQRRKDAARSMRVQAVSSGWYNGAYYQPGDVFDLNSPSDYSDSTQNAQPNGGEWAPGWMLEVASTTPTLQLLSAEPTPSFPIQPDRRAVL
jgi:hypothetical protein